ncbi:MAG: MoaD/ThiS family protein [Planctomycetaceae bacterium]|nr:MoaD/ThiS family protein [Planctomycetales bacterium]MCB9926637.1 MoaD/ThiS family protein [Planctomycetaceae bacterium]
MIRIEIPYHLRLLADIKSEVQLDVKPPITIGAVLDALESRYPTLRGTIRDHITHERRALLRYYACEQDFSLSPLDTPLPEPVAVGREPLLVIASVAGG